MRIVFFDGFVHMYACRTVSKRISIEIHDKFSEPISSHIMLRFRRLFCNKISLLESDCFSFVEARTYWHYAQKIAIK
jgi:hypothetical protein